MKKGIKKKVERRLKIIEGQVRGLQKMVDECNNKIEEIRRKKEEEIMTI